MHTLLPLIHGHTHRQINAYTDITTDEPAYTNANIHIDMQVYI